MLKIRLIFVMIVSSISYSFGQDNSYHPSWLKGLGGISNDTCIHVTVDHEDNVVLTGYFNDTLFVDQTSLLSAGEEDIFLIKLSNNGQLIWATRAGGIGFDRGIECCTDNNDNIYITGEYSNTAYFGDTCVESQGMSDIFIAKYASGGSFCWVQTAGGTNRDLGRSIGIDQTGNYVVISGQYMENAYFGTDYIPNQGYQDVFVAKCNVEAGAFVWVSHGGNYLDDINAHMIIGQDNSIYTTGYFKLQATFGSHHITGFGGKCIYMVKYNQDGEALWAKSAGGSGYDAGLGIAADNEGNLYFSGFFESLGHFDNIELNSYGHIDMYLAKLTPQGEYQWVIHAGGPGEDRARRLAVDDSNRVHLTGWYYHEAQFGSISIAGDESFNTYHALVDNGQFIYAQSAGGQGVDKCYGICLDQGNNVFSGGYFEQDFSCGDLTINSKGEGDVFVMKMTRCLPVWAQFNFSALNDPYIVVFENESANATSYFWDFGDGHTSNEINPMHTYEENGSYQVCLTACNSCDTSVFCDTVVICPPPVASFTYEIEFVEVRFFNQSSEASNLLWDFGDGTYSTETNPVHIYSDSISLYLACLSVENECSVSVFCDTIEIYPPPMAFFFFTAENNQVSLNSYTTEALSYYWDFGDGTYSDEINPDHIYQETGEYEVCLQVEFTNSSYQYCRTVNIQTLDIVSPNTKYDLIVYPNPTSGLLYLEWTDPTMDGFEVEVFDTHGSIVHKVKCYTKNDVISLTGISAGLYILKIFNSEQLYVKRVVKKR